MRSDCVIQPTRKPPVYYVGEYVAGSILLTTERTKVVESATTKIMGQSKVRWEKAAETRRFDFHRNRRRRVYTADQTFCHQIKRIGDGVLRPGVYMFNFRFKLNRECVTSFEGLLGYVRYEIWFVLKRVIGYDNVFKKAITVIKHNDLNIEPSFRIPPESAKSNDAQCSCLCNLSRSKCYFTVDVPFKAYTPGQRVKYTVKMHNKRAGKITDVIMRFIKRVTYTSTHPEQREEHTKTELLFRYFPGSEITNDLVEDNFMIPSTTPTGSDREMVYVHYYMKVRMEYSCCLSYNLRARQDIIVGTIPIKESLDASQLVASHLHDLRPYDIDGDFPFHPDIKPPTYVLDFPSGAHYVDYDIPPMERIVGFRPYYPMYKLPNELY